jgi:hypothetical protein
MQFDEKTAEKLAKAIVLHCFRNSLLEQFHAGIVPYSEKGDYSDVHVITPVSTIPWNETSKIQDAEMKELMRDAVNRLYRFLTRMHDEAFLEDFFNTSMPFTKDWDKPGAA